jgi:hypothetical protein
MADKVVVRDFGRIQARIRDIYGAKAVAAQAICRKYATDTVKNVRVKQGLKQGEGYYWTNRLSDAIKGIEGFVDSDSDWVGWGLMHTMEYGRWLELANNRKHAVLEPTVRALAPFFMDDIRKIYG